MKDDTREKLSAYLDNALTDAERRAVELEISRSEEMRLELEALRAVSGAVKGLPREKLPAGFLARLEARRTREGAAPARDYFILPPAYRPLAFALSTAVVALVIWDVNQAPSDIIAPRAGWDGGSVAVKTAAEAPPSFDVSGRLSELGAAGAGSSADAAAANELASAAKKEDADEGAPSTLGKHLNAPGKPLEFSEAGKALSGSAQASRGGSAFAPAAAPAPGSAAPALEPEPGEGGGAFVARSEEERSAINEKLYKGFEEEKKRMGIARIMDKDAESDTLAGGGRDMMALQRSPEAPAVGRARPAAAVRGANAKRAAGPVVKALTLKTAEALQAAWAAAGLPGEPPAVKFPGEMAVFLACPSGCGIVSIQNRKTRVLVLYKDGGVDDPAARARAVPASEKPVVLKPAE